MEDEEGYTALQFKERRKPEDEGEYSSLHFNERIKPEDRHEAILRGHQKRFCCLRRLLFISGALNILLLLAGISIGVLVFKYSQRLSIFSPASAKQCENKEGLSHKPSGSTGAEPGCERCPKDWMLHGDICYYFSKDKEVKTWSMSHEDCSSMSSRMLVIKDQAELSFVGQNVKHSNAVWLGLFLACPGKKWTWVNGSVLNSDWFQVTGTNEEGSCGASKKTSIYSEACVVEANWICEKDAKSLASRQCLLW
ncbi:killer cell lectin-like receptor subfamily B member 1B allele C [Pleurodeles waltl]|uniref:killer cell lectin-like receptor subfamily B member 1B allele C n=1 Tax=Pleurodeles waltl TaxID=8319 RepID=UPI0037098B0A